MKAKILTVALTALALGAGGCSGDLWKSKNALEEQKFAKFGQKKAREDALEGRDNTSAELLGKESFFSLGGTNKQSQEQLRFNKLFAGALEVVMEMPIQVANREGGFISTEWNIDPNDSRTRYRLNIRVSGQAPIGEVKVVVLKQVQQSDGSWIDQAPDTETARQIEKAIRKKS
ncbi:MAG: DUF3576 domain-containing protein [Magnetococcales bacterium]|nr:DUF3576 domain-containing protein [Magnetococcales bacterium]